MISLIHSVDLINLQWPTGQAFTLSRITQPNRVQLKAKPSSLENKVSVYISNPSSEISNSQKGKKFIFFALCRYIFIWPDINEKRFFQFHIHCTRCEGVSDPTWSWRGQWSHMKLQMTTTHCTRCEGVSDPTWSCRWPQHTVRGVKGSVIPHEAADDQNTLCTLYMYLVLTLLNIYDNVL